MRAAIFLAWGMLLLSGIFSPTFATDGAKLPDSFIERLPISKDGWERRCANWSNTEWQPKISDGHLTIIAAPKRITPKYPVWIRLQAAVLTEKCGGSCGDVSAVWNEGKYWLIGYDSGEWGGSLWRFAPAQKPVSIFDGNISRIFKWGGDLYAAGGLAHMGMDRGYIIPIEPMANGEIRVLPQIDVGSSVRDIVITDENSAVAITASGPILVHKDGWIKKATDNSSWEILYPSSALRARDGNIYVGMRYAVARLKPVGKDTFKETWIVSKDCRSFKATAQRECKCIP
jgi:hypothetical protein